MPSPCGCGRSIGGVSQGSPAGGGARRGDGGCLAGGVLVSGAELDSNPALHAGAHTDRGGDDALRCETASCCLTVKLS